MSFGKVRRTLAISLFAVCSLALPRTLSAQSESAHFDPAPAAKSERDAYSEKINAIYNFRFGKNQIAAPGNAALEGDGFIQPGAFPTASYCAHCHREAYTQWRQSLHSNSFRAPFYRTSVNILARTKGIEFTRHCDSCHNPIGVLTGALNENSNVDRRFDEDGLTCTTCHSIGSIQSTLGNGSFVMSVPAVMVDQNGTRIPRRSPLRRHHPPSPIATRKPS